MKKIVFQGTCACQVTSVVFDSSQPYDYSPPGSSVLGILQARILEWVAMPSSQGFPNPRIEPTCRMSPALVGGFFTH